MQLTFLGRGSAFNPPEGNTSAYWREDDRLLLLDCGESVFASLYRTGILNQVHEVWIAVSHFHSDHCGSLGTLVLYCSQALGFKARILLPPDDALYEEEIRQLLKIYGVPEQICQFLPETDLCGFQEITSFRFVRTQHAPGLNCYSFAFETPNGGVFYTADTCVTDMIRTFMNSHPDFEHIYAETVDAQSSPVHLPLHQLAALIPPGLRSRVTVMHLGNAETGDHARALGFGVANVDI